MHREQSSGVLKRQNQHSAALSKSSSQRVMPDAEIVSNLRLSLAGRINLLTPCAKQSRSSCASSSVTQRELEAEVDAASVSVELQTPVLRQLFIGTIQPQAPPKTPDVEVDGVHAVKLTERVTLLRGICNDRFKFEVEYGLKRGTSDNCYVVRVRRLHILVSQ